MTILLLVVIFILLIGPFRRTYIRNAAFALPATVGAVVGYCVGLLALSTGIPHPWLPPVGAVAGAIFAGEAGSEWFRRVFRR